MRALLKRVGLLTAAMVAVFVLFIAPRVSAQVNDFTITKFDADYTLTKADKQGTLQVTERIDVTFPHFNHGLLRALPNSYKHHKLQLDVQKVSSNTGAPVQYTTYQQNGNTVLKIGDPSRVITGHQQYTIQYTVNNVVGFYDDHDELYWDINGDQWNQETQAVSVVLHLPFGSTQLVKQSRCYAGGGFGSLASKCQIDDVTGDASVTARTIEPLAPRQTLSIVVGFEKGYFTPSPWYETFAEYLWGVAGFITPIVLLGGAAFRTWYTRGRDEKGRGVIVPQYDAPDGLLPLEVGTIVDFRTDNRDITAAIINLAIKRYITIIEQVQERKLRKDLSTYALRLDKTDMTGLNQFEQKLLKGLFSNFTAGNTVDLSVLKFKLSKTADSLRTNVRKQLVTDGYFRGSLGFGWAAKRILLVILSLAVLAVVFAIAGAWPAFMFGCFIGIVIAVLFMVNMPARTAKGTLAKEHILGLKMYLKTAEADRLKKLQSPNAPYNPAHAPKHTVNLFEKLLPYAMVLGVEQDWAKQFENIYTTPPDWYSGNWTAFNAGYLASSLSTGIGGAVNSAFSSPSSSGDSGFSGGGSGGGGGGGGGGGW